MLKSQRWVRIIKFIERSIKNEPRERYTIARYSMYLALENVLAAADRPEHRCLSISRSDFLGRVCGLKQASFVAADYPTYSMTNLSLFADGGFDSCVSDQVIEHVEGDPFKAIGETLRVIKLGGYIVHTTCMMNEVHGVPGDFWRFTPSALSLLVASAGGQPILVGSWGNKEAQAIIDLGFRAAAIPKDPEHPMHQIATRNDPLWPITITTWIVAQKPTP